MQIDTPTYIPYIRYAVLDGKELLGIWDHQDVALNQAHFYEQSQVILYGRLVICDIMPIRGKTLVYRRVAHA